MLETFCDGKDDGYIGVKSLVIITDYLQECGIILHGGSNFVTSAYIRGYVNGGSTTTGGVPGKTSEQGGRLFFTLPTMRLCLEAVILDGFQEITNCLECNGTSKLVVGQKVGGEG